MIFAQWRWLRQTLYPYTILLQTVPIVAIAPLIINWVGAGIFSVTVVTFIICLAPIIANTTQGLISVDENLIHLFVMHKATPAQILFKLRLPNAMPNLFTGIRISAGISVIGGITGELFAGSTRVGEGGLGYAIIYASNQMETSYLFALVFAATVLGFCFFFIVMFLEWLFLHNWHESSRPQTGGIGDAVNDVAHGIGDWLVADHASRSRATGRRFRRGMGQCSSFASRSRARGCCMGIARAR